MTWTKIAGPLSETDHNHDLDYADIDHNHNSQYSALAHTHTGLGSSQGTYVPGIQVISSATPPEVASGTWSIAGDTVTFSLYISRTTSKIKGGATESPLFVNLPFAPYVVSGGAGVGPFYGLIDGHMSCMGMTHAATGELDIYVPQPYEESPFPAAYPLWTRAILANDPLTYSGTLPQHYIDSIEISGSYRKSV